MKAFQRGARNYGCVIAFFQNAFWPLGVLASRNRDMKNEFFWLLRPPKVVPSLRDRCGSDSEKRL